MIRNWYQIRAKGKFRFILFHGVFAYGFFAGLIKFLIDLFVHHSYSFGSVWTMELTRSLIGCILTFMLIGGPIFGSIMWMINEKLHKKKVVADIVSRYT